MSCISKCCGAQGVDSGEKVTCAPQGVAQITLLVCSLLFAAAAVASHFGGLGLPGVVAFSVASGLSMASFVGVCIKSACNSTAIRVDNDSDETSISNRVHEGEIDTNRPAYELEIDQIRKRSRENPLDYSDFSHVLTAFRNHYQNSGPMMDYLVKQYGDRDARLLGQWIQFGLSFSAPKKDGEVYEEWVRMDVPLLNAVRKDREVFGKVVDYWFSEPKFCPAELLVDLSEEEIQLIVDKALEKSPKISPLLISLSTARHGDRCFPVSNEQIKGLQKSIISKIMETDANFGKIGIALCLRILKNKNPSQETLLNHVIKDIEEHLEIPKKGKDLYQALGWVSAEFFWKA